MNLSQISAHWSYFTRDKHGVLHTTSLCDTIKSFQPIDPFLNDSLESLNITVTVPWGTQKEFSTLLQKWTHSQRIENRTVTHAHIHKHTHTSLWMLYNTCNLISCFLEAKLFLFTLSLQSTKTIKFSFQREYLNFTILIHII